MRHSRGRYIEDDGTSIITGKPREHLIQGYNSQIAVDEDEGFIVGYKMSNATNDQNQFGDVCQGQAKMSPYAKK